MENIPIKLLQNPSIQRFEGDEYIVMTDFGALGGSTSFERAKAVVDWLKEAIFQLEKTELSPGIYNHPIEGLNSPITGGDYPA